MKFKAKPAKYQPGAADPEQEEKAKRPDKAPKIKWVSEKTYKNMEDDRADSGEEYSPPGAEADEERHPDEDEKQQVVEKKRKNPKRKVRPKKKFKYPGKKVYVIWQEEVEDEKAVVLLEYKNHLIVYFRKEGTIMGADLDTEVERITNDNPLSQKWVDTKIKENTKQIKIEKERIDEL